MQRQSKVFNSDVPTQIAPTQGWGGEQSGDNPCDAGVDASVPIQEEPMRVLLVGPYAATAVTGGMEKQLDLFLKSTAAKRLRISTFEISRGQKPQHSPLGRFLYAPFFVFLFLWRLLKSNARTVQIRTTSGIVFWKCAVCVLIGKLCRRKVVLSIHAPDFEDFFNATGKVGKTAIRWTLESPDHIIALSEVWRVFILMIAPRAQITVIPNGVEEEYFNIGTSSHCHPYDGKVRLLFMGSGEWERTVYKGFLDIVAAFRSNTIAHECVLTAAGVIDPEIKRSTADLPVTYPGIVSTSDKLRLFAEVDILVQPSHGENMPNIILEAMAAGLPIVSTSVGAIPEMIDEPRGGILVEPEDVAALVAAINRLVDDVGLRRQMGESNVQRARQLYHLTSTTQRWVNLICEVGATGGSSGKRPCSGTGKS